MTRVRKAIIPAAGLGTRFLPATKTVPKELLPIVDRPTLLYVVEEAARAGIEDIILISGRGKSTIEDFFDRSYELEDILIQSGKTELLEKATQVQKLANIISVRQHKALGLGHAVWTGRRIVGQEPFAVLLGDEITAAEKEQKTVTETLTDCFNETQLSTVAVMEVPEDQVSKYGIVAGKWRTDGRWEVSHVVEKPDPQSAPSRLALPGRYVFDPKIFEYLENTKPGKNGEIQLTDAMTDLAWDPGLLATTFNARRYDAGDKLGYLKANVELALEHPELAEDFREYLKQKAKQL